jgi:hypothetical protein
MGSTESCDTNEECAIRACNFTKHTSADINFNQDGIPENERDDTFVNNVNDSLDKFLKYKTSTNTINKLSSTITSKNTPTMDINANCIGFSGAVKTETQSEEFEKFTYQRTPTLISCTIASILVISVAILIWRSFVSRNAILYQQPSLPDQTIDFQVDEQ